MFGNKVGSLFHEVSVCFLTNCCREEQDSAFPCGTRWHLHQQSFYFSQDNKTHWHFLINFIRRLKKFSQRGQIPCRHRTLQTPLSSLPSSLQLQSKKNQNHFLFRASCYIDMLSQVASRQQNTGMHQFTSLSTSITTKQLEMLTKEAYSHTHTLYDPSVRAEC